MEIDVSKLSDEQVAFEVPDACPRCGADFTVAGNLITERWVSVEWGAKIVRTAGVPDGALVLDGRTLRPIQPDNLLVGIRCRCGRSITGCNETCAEGCDGEFDSVLHHVNA